MTKKPDPRTRLLAETFADDWESGPAGAFARQAAARARRRHRARQAIIPASALTAVVALGFTLFFSRSVKSENPVAPTSLTPRSVETALATKISPSFEIISDEQLMAALSDRPLLILPQESARPKLVVLER